MSLLINTNNTSIYKIIKRLDNLIENQYVINHISIIRYYLNEDDFILEDDKEIKKEAVHLKAQFQKLYNSNNYQITHFDSYGRKSKTETYENKKEFRKAFYRYANGKLIPYRFNKFGKIRTREKYLDLKEKYKDLLNNFDESKILSYHKQRVSKKLTSGTFVSNEMDIKLEVYKWLLNKNKDAVIIPEYSIGNRRADYIGFNTQKIDVTIVEIKSELDTFDRLDAQLEKYSLIANNVYLAIDKKQYEKLLSKNIVIPGHIGILIYDNNKSKKLIVLKKATKNVLIKEEPFIGFLSYNDINNAFSGFKYSSKLTKEQKEVLISKIVNKKVYNQFAYDILCNRHLIESDKRKDLFYKAEIILSVSSAKELKINRFDVTGKYVITLNSYVKDKDILYKYFQKQEQLFFKEFANYPTIKEYIKIHGDDAELMRKELRKKDIYIKGVGNNQIDLMNSLVENKVHVIEFLDSIIEKQGMTFVIACNDPKEGRRY